MENSKNIQSVLKLNKMVFDKIEFKRLGLKTENELELEIESNIAQRKESEVYRVTLLITATRLNHQPCWWSG